MVCSPTRSAHARAIQTIATGLMMRRPMNSHQKRRVLKAEKEKHLNIINSSYKCTLCEAWIKYPSRKWHLRKEHNFINRYDGLVG